MSTELVRQDSQIATQEKPADLMSIIDKVVGSGPIDGAKVDVLERLLAMQMTIREEQRKAAYAGAMQRLQARIPQIEKNGVIFNKDKTTVRSRFSKIEDIDEVIRPMVAEEGFSISQNEEPSEGTTRRYSTKFLHIDGHSETKYFSLPFDRSEFRTDAQSEAATRTFAWRQLLKMHLNIIEKGFDNDAGSEKTITEIQAQELQTILNDAKADIPKFLELITDVKKIGDIPARDWRRVLRAAEMKAAAKK